MPLTSSPSAFNPSLPLVLDERAWRNGRFDRADESAHVVVVDAAWLERRDASERRGILTDLARITTDTLIVERPGQSRAWWEPQLFEAGFRRATRFFSPWEYEQLEDEITPACVIVQKVPAEAAVRYTLAGLQAERNLHMDMLRETGRRSDAHLARYAWARDWVRPGDVVVDAACGLGYGTAMLADGTEASRLIGLDLSSSVIDYARACFLPGRDRLEYRVADAEAWEGWPDDSVDCIVSFETIEHLPSPDRFLAGAHRVLKPGGRFLCSVPNLWVDDTGHDPNPFHFQVFNLDRLADLVSSTLIVDEVYAQSAGGHAARFDARRMLRNVHWPAVTYDVGGGAEWWLMTAVKDPWCEGTALQKAVMSVRSPRLRARVAERVLASSPGPSQIADALLEVAAALPADAAAGTVDALADRLASCLTISSRMMEATAAAVRPLIECVELLHRLADVARARVEARARGERTAPLDLARLSAEDAALRQAIRDRVRADGDRVRVGIFGTGTAAMKVWESAANIGAEVRWFADNDGARCGTARLLWHDVVHAGLIATTTIDAVVVGSMHREPIVRQLHALGFEPYRIITIDVSLSAADLERDLRGRLSPFRS